MRMRTRKMEKMRNLQTLFWLLLMDASCMPPKMAGLDWPLKGIPTTPRFSVAHGRMTKACLPLAMDGSCISTPMAMLVWLKKGITPTRIRTDVP
jgi:hypothetical protein